MVDLGSEFCVWPAPDVARRRWPAFLASVSAAIRSSFAGTIRVDQAHVRRCQAEVVTDETIRDVGLSRDVILGEPTWQQDLPFFMQRGFR